MAQSPAWTEALVTNFNSSGVSVSLAANTTLAQTIASLNTKFIVRFLVRIARTATTALTQGVTIRVRPVNALTGAGASGEASYANVGQLATAQSTTCSGANSNSGQSTLNVGSTTSWAVGDAFCIGGGTAREEWQTVARVINGTSLLCDSLLQYTHTTAQADTVINKSDLFVFELPGTPSGYQLVADNGNNGTGVRVWAAIQTLDSVG